MSACLRAAEVRLAAASVTGLTDLTYRWSKDGQPLTDGPTAAGSVITGSTTPELTITTVALADAGSYSWRVENLCGGDVSQPATLQVCAADFDCSGVVTLQDLFDFLAAYFAQDPRADVNGANGVTIQDVFDYLVAYFARC